MFTISSFPRFTATLLICRSRPITRRKRRGVADRKRSPRTWSIHVLYPRARRHQPAGRFGLPRTSLSLPFLPCLRRVRALLRIQRALRNYGARNTCRSNTLEVPEARAKNACLGGRQKGRGPGVRERSRASEYASELMNFLSAPVTPKLLVASPITGASLR